MKQAQRKAVAKVAKGGLKRSPKREAPQLCCGISSGMDNHSDFNLQCPYFGCLFLFVFSFLLLGISLRLLEIIIQSLPKVCVF